MSDTPEKELGTQPLDQKMEELSLSNAALVQAYEGQMSHKMVSKARRGRRITRRMQIKIKEAFNSAALEKDPDFTTLKAESLFNYVGS